MSYDWYNILKAWPSCPLTRPAIRPAIPTATWLLSLSYGKSTYANLKLTKAKIGKTDAAEATATVTNVGPVAADEAVQRYLTHPPKAGAQTPLFALKGLRRLTLKPGASAQVKFALTPAQLALIDKGGSAFAPSGPVTVWVSGSLPSARSPALGAPKPVSAVLTIK